MLFAGTHGGVYRIPEHSFEQADLVLDGVSVRALHSRDGTLFAATGSGIFETDDRGQHWDRLGVPAADVHSRCSTSDWRPRLETPLRALSGFRPTDSDADDPAGK